MSPMLLKQKWNSCQQGQDLAMDQACLSFQGSWGLLAHLTLLVEVVTKFVS